MTTFPTLKNLCINGLCSTSGDIVEAQLRKHKLPAGVIHNILTTPGNGIEPTPEKINQIVQQLIDKGTMNTKDIIDIKAKKLKCRGVICECILKSNSRRDVFKKYCFCSSSMSLDLKILFQQVYPNITFHNLEEGSQFYIMCNTGLFHIELDSSSNSIKNVSPITEQQVSWEMNAEKIAELQEKSITSDDLLVAYGSSYTLTSLKEKEEGKKDIPFVNEESKKS